MNEETKLMFVMKAKTKFKLCALTLAIATPLYGYHRFHSSRYSPQCDQIPNVCVYGDKKPTSSNAFANESKQSLSICEGEKCRHVNAEYSDKTTTVILPEQNGMRCVAGEQDAFVKDKVIKVPGKIQIVQAPFDTWIVKGCKSETPGPWYVKLWEDYASRYTLEAPLMGLKEMFSSPKPLDLSCSKTHETRMETTYACKDFLASKMSPPSQSQKKGSVPFTQPDFKDMGAEWQEGCSKVEKLEKVSDNGKDGDVKCRAEEARERLIRALKGQKGYVLPQEITNSDAVLKQDDAPEAYLRRYWKGWDYLFMAGFVGVIVLTLQSYIRKDRFKKGKSIEEQLRERGIDPDGFNRSVDALNQAQGAGLPIVPGPGGAQSAPPSQAAKDAVLADLEAILQRINTASTMKDFSDIRMDLGALKHQVETNLPTLYEELKLQFQSVYTALRNKEGI